ncbi:MAG: hypothetical protein NZM10_04495, partial [Fimbriimonadales bacterium]|nr:hypothetical protein [Fimbriimonadales bacterium]
TNQAAYCTGAWILLWGIGRLSSVMLGGRSLVSARALALVFITALLTLPVIIHIMFFGTENKSPALSLWLAKPFFDAMADPRDVVARLNLLNAGAIMLVVGLALGFFTRPRKV